jgi:hypothetical protein
MKLRNLDLDDVFQRVVDVMLELYIIDNIIDINRFLATYYKNFFESRIVEGGLPHSKCLALGDI